MLPFNNDLNGLIFHHKTLCANKVTVLMSRGLEVLIDMLIVQTCYKWFLKACDLLKTALI